MSQLVQLTEICQSYEDWAFTLGEQIGRLATAESAVIERKFLIGDFYLWGRATYGEHEAVQAVPDTDYAKKTIQNITRVCELVPPERRNLALTFGHHDAVARLEPQKQIEMLSRAEEEGLSVYHVRSLIGQERKGERTGPEYKIWSDKLLENETIIATFLPGLHPIEYYQKKLLEALSD